jgi:RNA polymerase sigma-70 factor (ECF subfamily)
MRAWLFAILHNTFIDRRRSRQAEDVRIAQSGELAVAHQEAAQDQHVRLDQVRRAFMGLPEEQRAALHLVAIEDLTYAEAAANLGIPTGTLMSRLARARATLRAIEDGPAPAAVAPGLKRHLKIVGGGNGPVG